MTVFSIKKTLFALFRYDYLKAVDGEWALHVAIERNCSLYEMKSDNIVEGVFSWLKDERTLITPFYVIQAMDPTSLFLE